MVDNRAHVVRTYSSNGWTPVDAVRVWGLVGSFLQIRGLRVTGDNFRYGVLVRDTTDSGAPQGRVRHISDVLNLEGVKAVDVPPTVTTERCVP